MAFKIKKRGKLTYYYRNEYPLFSNLVTEDLGGGDFKIYFAGFTGGESAARHLNLPEIVSMDPDREIPLVFRGWEAWLREAGICRSLREIDFIEMHVFGCQPKAPSAIADPAGYAAEENRLREAYARAYGGYFRQHLPENGVPARFTVHLIDVPDKAASYEFYTTALYQPGLTRNQS